MEKLVDLENSSFHVILFSSMSSIQSDALITIHCVAVNAQCIKLNKC